MVRRSSRKFKTEVVNIDLTRLSKEGLLVLQRYIDQYVVAPVESTRGPLFSLFFITASGQRLPTVSAKTSYKHIYKHTKKFNTARRTMAVLASKIQSSSRRAAENYCADILELPKDEFLAFLATQSRLVDDMLDECDKMIRLCEEFEKESEGDLAKLQHEVTRLKVATNAKERRDLLLEMTRGVPVIPQVKDVFNELVDGLRAIQHELNILEDKSDCACSRILYIWGIAFSSGLQLLV
ncbi:hypothetical protein B0H19DRAFT_420837 [Mycena capillaripes]|nr:hypothetical protein B0H19DRAFT_420837 [Mycena capillaripes]